ncbi:MAG TPA: sigma factor-like helix-turn-helix DNA-binding protein [Candidatus Dormibacteraeota bacterium]
MDQVHVQAPRSRARTGSVERDFYSDFPLLVNYVARLTDDLDEATGIACEAFRQATQLKRGQVVEGLSRIVVFRTATELSRQALRPRRWFRRRRSNGMTLEGFPQPEARRALRRDTVQRALTALPFEARAIVLLRDYAKLSYDELAEVVDIAPRKLVHAVDRSRAELKEIYEYIKF